MKAQKLFCSRAGRSNKTSKRSASVNDKAKALLDLIAPAYVSESEIPAGYLCVEDVARLHNMSLPGAQNKMQSLRRKGVVDVVKAKMSNGKIKNFYGVK